MNVTKEQIDAALESAGRIFQTIEMGTGGETSAGDLMLSAVNAIPDDILAALFAERAKDSFCGNDTVRLVAPARPGDSWTVVFAENGCILARPSLPMPPAPLSICSCGDPECDRPLDHTV